jgi:FMN-dependent NADH-azoreductase
MKILHIDSSALPTADASKTRKLSAEIVGKLCEANGKDTTTVTYRDVACATSSPKFVCSDWVSATFTPEDARTPEQKQVLANQSDKYVDELIEADVIIIGMPIYNFMIPACLKAWIDMVCRVGRTFQYTATGPVGLLNNNKKVILVTASGGTPIGSNIDFATPYMRHILGFIGLTDVEIVGAEKGDVETAQSQITTLMDKMSSLTTTTADEKKEAIEETEKKVVG